jgi:broad specificity phosphatase PhoE
VAVFRYLTHPQVVIDPATPVPDWGLNETGQARVAALAASGWLQGTGHGTVLVVSSAERKAIETAEPLAEALGAPCEVRAEMHENDRSATGFLATPEFEAAADAFFAEPMASFQGWERAIDAQARVVAQVNDVLAAAPTGDVLFVGHGGVGTLLYCHCAGLPISRAYDQIGGGGCYITYDRATRRPHHPWRLMEVAPQRQDAS